MEQKGRGTFHNAHPSWSLRTLYSPWGLGNAFPQVPRAWMERGIASKSESTPVHGSVFFIGVLASFEAFNNNDLNFLLVYR